MTEMSKDICGVPGRITTIPWDQSGPRFMHQTWRSESRDCPDYGPRHKIRVQIRFDDNCKNGHNSFSVTGDIYRPGARDVDACGCLHDEIAKHFPELAHLIKWHLVSTDGPMHYIANATYHASNRDYNGKLEGEPTHWDVFAKFGSFPILQKKPKKFLQWLSELDSFDLEVLPVAYDGKNDYDFTPKYTFGGYGDKWHTCPFDTEAEALQWLEALQRDGLVIVKQPTMYSKGKARDLAAARSVAVWPEATDAELMQDKATLTAALQARLPKLLQDFRSDIEAAGFQWAASDE